MNYERIKSLCSKAWNLSPDQFDAKCESGAINWPDVAELLLQMQLHPVDALWVDAYLNREDVLKQIEKEQQTDEIIKFIRDKRKQQSKTPEQEAKKQEEIKLYRKVLKQINES
jgi:hypothetical protein